MFCILGVMPPEAVNAAAIVVVLSCSISALVADRVVPRLPDPPGDEQPLGRTVLVPIAHPASAKSLIKVAAAIASKDGGLVIPVSVVLPGTGRTEGLDRLAANLEEMASAAGAEAHAVIRVDSSPEEGILHAITERDATSLVLGWSGISVGRFRSAGTTVGAILDRATLPTVIGRFSVEQHGRVVLVAHDTGPISESPSEALAKQVAERVAKAWDVELVVTRAPTSHDGVPVGQISHTLESTDLVVLPAPLSARALDRVALRSMTEWGGASLLMCIDIGLRRVESPGGFLEVGFESGMA